MLHVAPTGWKDARASQSWPWVDAIIVSGQIEKTERSGRGGRRTVWCPRLQVHPPGTPQPVTLAGTGCANDRWLAEQWMRESYANGRSLRVVQNPTQPSQVQRKPDSLWRPAGYFALGLTFLWIPFVLSQQRVAAMTPQPPVSLTGLPSRPLPFAQREIKNPLLRWLWQAVQVLLGAVLLLILALIFMAMPGSRIPLLLALSLVGFCHWLEQRNLPATGTAPVKPAVPIAPKLAQASLRMGLWTLLLLCLLLSFIFLLPAMAWFAGPKSNWGVAVISAMLSLLPLAGALKVFRRLRHAPADSLLTTP